jgi:hypothetical protein
MRPFEPIVCPHCGLTLWISEEGERESISVQYDALQWERRCKVPALGSPTLCLMLKNGQRRPDLRIVQ